MKHFDPIEDRELIRRNGDPAQISSVDRARGHHQQVSGQTKDHYRASGVSSCFLLRVSFGREIPDRCFDATRSLFRSVHPGVGCVTRVMLRRRKGFTYLRTRSKVYRRN
jgi:hypothetical protein